MAITLPTLPAAPTPEPRAGSRTAGPSVDLLVRGMHCASCVSRIEGALAGVPAVAGASVDLMTGRARVSLRSAEASEEVERALIEAIAAAGYEATVDRDDAGDDSESVLRALRLASLGRRFAVAALVAVPVAALSMLEVRFPLRDELFLVVTAFVLGFSGHEFFAGAVAAARRKTADMNTLIALGTFAALAGSAAVTLLPATFHLGSAHPPVYYESALVIVAFVLLGKLLEERAKGRAGDAIRRLVARGATDARRLAGGREERVPIASLRPGDLIRVLPAETVPADGVVTEGRPYVDESMMTGEPLPVIRPTGSPVVGGTLNGETDFVLRVTAAGRDAALGQIVRLVRSAQASKAPVQKLADRIAAVFVPAVLGIALLSFAAWFLWGPEPRLLRALGTAIAVLVVACPCALGLATPAAILAGAGRGAETGILVRDAAALERARRVTTVVFDKTGTLTSGRPDVTAVLPAPGVDAGELLRNAGSLERRATHPLGRAVVRAATERGIELPAPAGVRSVAGAGISGLVDGIEVRAGSRSFLLESGVVLPQLPEAGPGRSEVVVSRAGRYLGTLAVEDPIRPGAREAVAALRAERIEVRLLTGDRPEAARRLAIEAGIDEENVFAGVGPGGKASAVASLRHDGAVVAMVGDGVNDAPALAAADVGIALAGGTDVAAAAADLTLVGGSLAGVLRAIRLSRATVRTIHQNLALAFVYNALLIPVAAGALYPWLGITLDPMLAGAAMALSSVSVVANALRLTRLKL